MEIKITRRDLILSGLILAVFGAWVAWALYDNRVMKRELERAAELHIDEWFSTESEGVNKETWDYLAIVDSEKAFTLFGRGWGVVHTYFRKKGDEEFETFKGLEYYYVREDGEWVLKDFVGCGAFEHHIRAFDEFLNIGVDVPNRIYDRALGIDFEYDHLSAKRAEEQAGDTE